MAASLLTQRSLKVYAVLQSYQGGTGDIVEALTLFFEPFIRERHGKVFSPSELANAVNQEYRWRMTSAVIESFVDRFVEKGWLARIAESEDGALWRYGLEPSESEAPSQSSITDVMDLVQREFAAFVDKIHPLKFEPRSPESLFDALIRWLVYVDGYSSDILRLRSAHASVDTDGKLSLYQRLPDDSNVSPEEKYLAARFTQHVLKDDSQLAPALARLASIGLLTEVIQDLRHPTSATRKTNLRIYLDGPVALEYCGLSGRAEQSHIRFLVDHLRTLGAEIRIFRDTLDEMHRVLAGMLRRPKIEREGATADALKRGELIEEVVIAAARDPSAVVRKARIDIVERNLTMFPHQHKHFDQKTYDEFYDRITWHLESKPKAHDAAATALVVREREGKTSRDIFESGAVLLTKSHWLTQLVRAFCIENGIIGADQVSPVVQLKQMAAFSWLRTGLSTEKEDVPRQFVMAACEKILELRPNVISQFAALARKLAPDNAEQYEMLVTMDRGAQALMDKALGSPKAIEPDNFDEVLAAVERGVADKVQKRADEEIERLKRESRETITAAEAQARRSEETAQAALSTLEQISRDEQSALRAMFRVIKRRIGRRRLLLSGAIYAALIALFALTLTSGMLEGALKVVALVALALIVTWLAWLQLTERTNLVDNYIGRVREHLIEKEANERDLVGALYRWPDIADEP